MEFKKVRSGNSEFYNQDYSGVIQLIVPEETTNLITNPSVELSIAGYHTYNSTLTGDITYQNRGKYSLKVNPNTCTIGSPSATQNWIGTYYKISLTAGLPYTFSVDVKGKVGGTYVVFFWSSDYAIILGRPTYFIGNGEWQRAWTTYNEVLSADRYVSIFELVRIGTMCSPFYVDGLQVEAKAYPTTYCDGDMIG
jgi:hypothetical protein